MKNFNFLFIFLITTSASAQISLSINHNRVLEASNKDNYSYHLMVRKQGKEIINGILPAGQTLPLSEKLKSKRSAKKLKVTWAYDQAARDYDAYQATSRSEQQQNRAAHIEGECWGRMRQKGWMLVAAAVISGDGRFLEALLAMLKTSNMDASNIGYEIDMINRRAEERISEKERFWLESLTAYYQVLLAALVDPFGACPELKSEKGAILHEAQRLKESVALYDTKLKNEKGNSEIRNAWKDASNRYILRNVMPGMEVEFNGIVQGLNISSGQRGTLPIKSSGIGFDSRINKRLFFGQEKRLAWYGTVSYGQSNVKVRSSEQYTFLGVQDVTSAQLKYAIDHTKAMHIRYSYSGLGLKLMLMIQKVNLSLEAGANLIAQKSIDLPDTLYTVANNNLSITSRADMDTPTQLFKQNSVSPGLGLQIAFPLISFGPKVKNSYRNKVVMGIGIRGTYFSAGNAKLVEVTSKNNTSLSRVDNLTYSLIGFNAGLKIAL